MYRADFTPQRQCEGPCIRQHGQGWDGNDGVIRAYSGPVRKRGTTAVPHGFVNYCCTAVCRFASAGRPNTRTRARTPVSLCAAPPRRSWPATPWRCPTSRASWRGRRLAWPWRCRQTWPPSAWRPRPSCRCRSRTRLLPCWMVLLLRERPCERAVTRFVGENQGCTYDSGGETHSFLAEIFRIRFVQKTCRQAVITLPQECILQPRNTPASCVHSKPEAASLVCHVKDKDRHLIHHGLTHEPARRSAQQAYIAVLGASTTSSHSRACIGVVCATTVHQTLANIDLTGCLPT